MTTIKEIFNAEREFIRSAYPIYEQPYKIQRIDSLETTMQAEIDARDARIAELEVENSGIEKENDDLSAWCTEKNKMIDGYKQRIDNLEAEMDALRNRVQQVIDAERDGDGWCCYAAFQTTIDRIKAALWGENPQVCEWTEYDSEYPGTYKTSCGDLFSFTEGGIAENGAEYCMHCGRMIKPTEKP